MGVFVDQQDSVLRDVENRAKDVHEDTERGCAFHVLIFNLNMLNNKFFQRETYRCCSETW
jgi:hypothetical protein